jgi:hypothetical protein
MTTKKIVLIVAGVVVVLGFLVLLFVGAIVGFAFYQLGNSEAAARAQDFLRNSPKLKQDIGEVRDFGSIGEKRTVNASVDLVLVSGSTWRVSSAAYVNDSGERIDLLDPFDSRLLIPRLIA